jgi:hypothetical protein
MERVLGWVDFINGDMHVEVVGIGVYDANPLVFVVAQCSTDPILYCLKGSS